MTPREQKLWIMVAVVVGSTLVYRLSFSYPDPSADLGQPRFSLVEARRLLRSEPGIEAREEASCENLRQLRSHFLPPDGQSPAELRLLRLVEQLAARSGLSVHLKDTVAFSPTELGVSLEGLAAAKTIVGFLQQVAATPLNLQVKQLQLHSVPEQKVLNYRIELSTPVVR
jgi:hypothetical protein